MSDVTGPICSLPGSTHIVPEGMMCDRHEDRPATHRVQGETDSFGCEMIDMCEECFQKYKAHKDDADGRTGRCDYCKQHATDLSPRRDPDEGMCGPVYQVCGSCRKSENERLAAEYDECADDDDRYYDDPCDSGSDDPDLDEIDFER